MEQALGIKTTRAPETYTNVLESWGVNLLNFCQFYNYKEISSGTSLLSPVEATRDESLPLLSRGEDKADKLCVITNDLQ